ncbi:MAG: hypothetical protein M1816_007872 [Peltula sp. TS41687]|nr:MAG: hypothetical protein M1816_007872 [Peltula sp. TS41687]
MASTEAAAAVSTPVPSSSSSSSSSSSPDKKIKPEKAGQPDKPEKPDEEKYKADLAKAEKEYAAAMEQLNAIRSKLDAAKPPANGSPTQLRQQELRDQLSTIRKQQQECKSSKGNLQERIRQLDSGFKSRLNEQKAARARIPFKNVEEIDRQIQQLEKQVDTGTMKLVDEKKALQEVSNLRKQRKGFAQLDEAQKGIDDIKAQLTELRKGLDDPEAKALSERYTGIAKELDDIRAAQDEAYKSINSLRDERSKLHTEQQQKFAAIRAIKDQYYGQKKAYGDYEHEAYRARKERQKAERDAQEKERRRKIADQRLEEASQPAFLDQIMTAEGLIRYFDPSFHGSTMKDEEKGGKFAAQASRVIDASDIKGTKVVRKDDREDTYFVGTGGKKGKRGRKNGNAAAASPARTSTPTESSVGTATPTSGGGKFNLSMGIIEELSKVDVEPPMSQADVPAVVDRLKHKVEEWKSDQDRQTKANIEKARKEIDRLEAAETQSPSSPEKTTTTTTTTTTNNNSSPSQSRRSPAKDTKARKPAATNGEGEGEVSASAELAQEKDAVADAADDLEKAKLEDEE